MPLLWPSSLRGLPSGVQHFDYPIGLALFNRPTYKKALLESLSKQTMAFDRSLLTIHVDNYQGSRDQEVGRPDFTQTTIEFARQYAHVLESQLIIPKHNQGIAKSLTALENRLFENTSGEWVVIIEGDMVLSTRALEIINQCIKQSDQYPSVAVINFDYADWEITNTRFSFVRGHGTRIYALRRTHHIERKPVIAAFNQLLENQSYHSLTYDQVLETVAPFGVYPSNKLQDALRTATSVAFRRLQIAPKINVAAHIGHYGQNNIYTEGRIPWIPAVDLLSEHNLNIKAIRLIRLNLFAIRWNVGVRRLRVFRKISIRAKWIMFKAIRFKR
jgi:GR25 family glycosyltransferase involved in LPS biosynthesis